MNSINNFENYCLKDNKQTNVTNIPKKNNSLSSIKKKKLLSINFKNSLKSKLSNSNKNNNNQPKSNTYLNLAKNFLDRQFFTKEALNLKKKYNSKIETIIFFIFTVAFIFVSFYVINNGKEINYKKSILKNFEIDYNQYIKNNILSKKSLESLFEDKLILLLKNNFQIHGKTFELISPVRLTCRYGKYYETKNNYIKYLDNIGNPLALESYNLSNNKLNKFYNIEFDIKENLYYEDNNIKNIKNYYDFDNNLSYLQLGGYVHVFDRLDFYLPKDNKTVKRSTFYDDINLFKYPQIENDSFLTYTKFIRNSQLNEYNNSEQYNLYKPFYDVIKNLMSKYSNLIKEDNVSSITFDLILFNKITNDYIAVLFNYNANKNNIVENIYIFVLFNKLFQNIFYAIAEGLFYIVVIVYTIFIIYKLINETNLELQLKLEKTKNNHKNSLNQLNLNYNNLYLDNKKESFKIVDKNNNNYDNKSEITKISTDFLKSKDISIKNSPIKSLMKKSFKASKIPKSKYNFDKLMDSYLKNKLNYINSRKKHMYINFLFKNYNGIVILLFSIGFIIIKVHYIFMYQYNIKGINNLILSKKEIFNYSRSKLFNYIEINYLKGYLNNKNNYMNNNEYLFLSPKNMDDIISISMLRNNIKFLIAFIYIFLIFEIVIKFAKILPSLNIILNVVINSLKDLATYLILLINVFLAVSIYFYISSNFKIYNNNINDNNNNNNKYYVHYNKKQSNLEEYLFLVYNLAFNSMYLPLYYISYNNYPLISVMLIVVSFVIIRLLIVNFSLAIIIYNYKLLKSNYCDEIKEFKISKSSYKSYKYIISTIKINTSFYIIKVFINLITLLVDSAYYLITCKYNKLNKNKTSLLDVINVELLSNKQIDKEYINNITNKKLSNLSRIYIKNRNFYKEYFTEIKELNYDILENPEYHYSKISIFKLFNLKRNKLISNNDTKSELYHKDKNLLNDLLSEDRNLIYSTNRHASYKSILNKENAINNKSYPNNNLTVHNKDNDIKDILDSLCADEYLIFKENEYTNELCSNNEYFESQNDRIKKKLFFENKYINTFKLLLLSIFYIFVLSSVIFIIFTPYHYKEQAKYLLNKFIEKPNLINSNQIANYVFDYVPKKLNKIKEKKFINLFMNNREFSNYLVYDEYIVTIDQYDKNQEIDTSFYKINNTEHVLDVNYNKTFIYNNNAISKSSKFTDENNLEKLLVTSNTNLSYNKNKGYVFDVGISGYNKSELLYNNSFIEYNWKNLSSEIHNYNIFNQTIRYSLINEFTSNVYIEFLIHDLIYNSLIYVIISINNSYTSEISINLDFKLIKLFLNNMYYIIIINLLLVIMSIFIAFYIYFFIIKFNEKLRYFKYQEDNIVKLANVLSLKIRYTIKPYIFRIIQYIISFRMFMDVVFIISGILIVLFMIVIQSLLYNQLYYSNHTLNESNSKISNNEDYKNYYDKIYSLKSIKSDLYKFYNYSNFILYLYLISMLILSIKFIYLTNLNKYFKITIQTILNVLSNNFMLFLLFIACQFGFIMYSYFAFGSYSNLYTNISDCIFNTFKVLFGRGSYYDVLNLSSTSGILFLIIITFVMKIIVINIIISVFDYEFNILIKKFYRSEIFSYIKIICFCCTKRKRNYINKNNIKNSVILDLNNDYNSIITNQKYIFSYYFNIESINYSIKNKDVKFTKIMCYLNDINNMLLKYDLIYSNAEQSLINNQYKINELIYVEDKINNITSLKELNVIRFFYINLINIIINNLQNEHFKIESCLQFVYYKKRTSIIKDNIIEIKAKNKKYINLISNYENKITLEMDNLNKISMLNKKISSIDNAVEEDFRNNLYKSIVETNQNNSDVYCSILEESRDEFNTKD